MVMNSKKLTFIDRVLLTFKVLIEKTEKTKDKKSKIRAKVLKLVKTLFIINSLSY